MVWKKRSKHLLVLTYWTLSCGLGFLRPLWTCAGSSSECSQMEFAPLLASVCTIWKTHMEMMYPDCMNFALIRVLHPCIPVVRKVASRCGANAWRWRCDVRGSGAQSSTHHRSAPLCLYCSNPDLARQRNTMRKHVPLLNVSCSGFNGQRKIIKKISCCFYRIK